MNLRNVLRAYGLLRSLSDDESALLNVLRTLNDNDRELLVQGLSDKPQKKSSKKTAGGGGKSKRVSSLQSVITNRHGATDDRQRPTAQTDDDGSDTRCQFTRSDGNPCKLLPDHNIHHLATANEYHEFQPAATSVAGASGD